MPDETGMGPQVVVEIGPDDLRAGRVVVGCRLGQVGNGAGNGHGFALPLRAGAVLGWEWVRPRGRVCVGYCCYCLRAARRLAASATTWMPGSAGQWMAWWGKWGRPNRSTR